MRILLFLLIPVIGLTQTDSIWVSGVVKDTKTKVILSNCLVSVNGQSIRTDKTGAYKLCVTEDTDKLIFKTTPFSKAPDTKGKMKPIYFPKRDTLFNPDINKINIFDIELHTIYQGCLSLPDIYFKTNSTEFEIDTILEKVKWEKFLKENPSTVLRISGQQFHFEKDSLIGLKRAKTFKELLISKGINKKRIQICGVQHTNEYYLLELFKFCNKYKVEIESSHFQNTKDILSESNYALKLEFKILHFDFPKTKAPKKQITKIDNFVPHSVVGKVIDQITKQTDYFSTVYLVQQYPLNTNKKKFCSYFNGQYYFEFPDSLKTSKVVYAKSDNTIKVGCYDELKFFQSQSGIIGHNVPFAIQNIKLEQMMYCGDREMPVIPDFPEQNELLARSKLKLNWLIETLKYHPTMKLQMNMGIKGNERIKNLIINYLKQKGVNLNRINISWEGKYVMDCYNYSIFNKKFKNFNEGDTLTRDHIFTKEEYKGYQDYKTYLKEINWYFDYVSFHIIEL